MLKASLGFVLSFFFIACTSLTKLQEPKVEVAKVTLDRIEGGQAHLLFHGKIKNPNNTSLSMDGIQYELLVNKEKVSSGNLEEKLSVAALGESEFSLPVAFGLDQVFKSLLAAFQDRKLNYEIAGAMKLGLFSVPFTKQGVVDLAAEGK